MLRIVVLLLCALRVLLFVIGHLVLLQPDLLESFDLAAGCREVVVVQTFEYVHDLVLLLPQTVLQNPKQKYYYGHYYCEGGYHQHFHVAVGVHFPAIACHQSIDVVVKIGNYLGHQSQCVFGGPGGILKVVVYVKVECAQLLD